ncbi:hypothetical protein BH20VER1_BH20VER1_09610 [soil metagenome]
MRNRTDHRIEVVLSVDGLDVIDGRRANFRKGGYLLEPNTRIEVDGFRQSYDAVAAFRFGSSPSPMPISATAKRERRRDRCRRFPRARH